MLLLLAVLCGLVEAFFTALEVALGAVSRARLRTLAEADVSRASEDATVSPDQSRRARAVLALLEHPDRLSLLFISVTSLSLWTAASLLTWQVISDAWSVPVLFGSFVALLFVAEVIPLLLAARHAEAIALRSARLVALALRVLRPLTWTLAKVTFGIARMFGSGPNPTHHVTEGELRTALVAAEEEGAIEAGERALIEGAMDLRTQSVREVMTPRSEIVGVPADAPLHKSLKIALREGHSRLPVYDGSLDNIIGVLATKDLLPYLQPTQESANPKRARDVTRAALFVPESDRVNVVLDELRRNRTLLAVVRDAEGCTTGLVTIEDLLEELVGEIQDEYDAEEAPVRLLNPNEVEAGAIPFLECDASSSVRELGRFCSEELNLSTTLRDASGAPVGSGLSLSALALDYLGSLPAMDDTALVGNAVVPSSVVSDFRRPAYSVHFIVSRMDGPRILELRVQFQPEDEPSTS